MVSNVFLLGGAAPWPEGRKGGTTALRLAWHCPGYRVRPFRELYALNPPALHAQCEVTPAVSANCYDERIGRSGFYVVFEGAQVKEEGKVWKWFFSACKLSFKLWSDFGPCVYVCLLLLVSLNEAKHIKPETVLRNTGWKLLHMCTRLSFDFWSFWTVKNVFFC